MIEVLFAAALGFVPGSGDPVCADPGVPVETCTTWQLPEEVVGRQIDGPNGEVWVVVGIDVNGDPILQPVAAPAPAPAPLPAELAQTGVPNRPYAAAAAALIVGGAGLVVIARRGRAHGR